MKIATAVRAFLACATFVSSTALGQPADPLVDTTADGPFMLGRADAPVTFVEFVDYECVFCRRFHKDVYDRLLREFVDTGLVRYVVRDFPMEIHKNSVTTARAARCAAQQGKFWEMRHALFTAPRVDLDGVVEAGQGAGLDGAKLRDCVANAKVNASIKQDREEGLRIGVSATPTFVIGRSKGDRVEGELIIGSKPYELYEARIRALLPPRRP